MEWLALLTGALKAIPVLSKDVRDLLGYFKKAEEAGWFQKNAEAFRPLLNGPTTKEQKDAAAKAIADSINKL